MSSRVVAFVPIKLQSQRLPGKNLKLLGPLPLLRYVFEMLVEIDLIDDVYAFCSDDSIIDLLPKKVKFLKREESLDSDETLGSEIYDSFVSKIDSDYYLLAHSTSPFIEADTIRDALTKVMSGDFDSAFTAQKIKNFVWYQEKPLNYSLDFVPRTQDIEPIYVECSAFFIFKKEGWTDYQRRIGDLPYMVLLSGRESVDIDDQEDFLLAQFYLDKDPSG